MSDQPRLHRSVTITRREIGADEVFFIVKDPRTGTFLRMGEVEVAVLRLLDGRRTYPEVAEALERVHEFRVPVDVIESFVDNMIRKGFVETRTFDPEAFREEWRVQERARKKTLGRMLGSITTIKAKLFNPRRLFGVLVGPLHFLWTPAFVVWSMAFLAAGGAMALVHRHEILRSMTEFFRSMTASAGSFATHAAVFYFAFFIVVAVHETAHGLTCTRFGGKVTDMGFILFYLQIPGFYCDVTDAYGFEKRSHRLWTTIAGGYTGLILASIGVFLWWVTEPGGVLNDASIGLMFVGGPPLLALNWNPLIRYDGYYILMDLLEAPNLMSNSRKYLAYLLKSKILRVPVEPMKVAPRLRTIYVVYGTASFLFLAPLICFIPVIIYYIFTGLLGAELGMIVAVVLGFRIIKPIVAKLFATLRYAWLSHRPSLMASLGEAGGRVRIGLMGAGALVGLVLALLGPRFAVRAEVIGTLEPWERIEVRAESPGLVTVEAAAAMPLEGKRIRKGDLLVRLENPDLEAEHRAAESDATALRLDLISLEAKGDPAEAAVRRAGLNEVESRRGLLARRLDDLSLRAPIDGVILTPRLEHRAGAWLDRGDVWCVLGRTDRLRIRAQLSQTDLGLIDEAGEARIKALHLPGRTFSGRVSRLPAGRPPEPPPALQIAGTQAAPATPARPDEMEIHGSLAVEVQVDNAEGLLLPGMRVRARIYGERLTPLGHLGRWARRLFKGKVWW